jgi:hypothetical protein
MANRIRTAVWNSWRSHAASLKASRETAARIIARLRHGALSSAFDAWLRVASLLRRAREEAAVRFAGANARLLAAASAGWGAVVQERRSQLQVTGMEPFGTTSPPPLAPLFYTSNDAGGAFRMKP